ncbi:hypothetical protein [Paraburkholderia acidisoli]|uniref:Uncharacterized protein n=1 Tax=Paraburkholderia acidisoli TaxID=2571748 RepID=A0A7Z2GMR0_9BURK|nr:hypothetical protein [Paraburkholderia acidisoli]QGZ64421.1 hypothetical protein FAZ98_22135 [Paraburkholderia acidisoli]
MKPNGQTGMPLRHSFPRDRSGQPMIRDLYFCASAVTPWIRHASEGRFHDSGARKPLKEEIVLTIEAKSDKRRAASEAIAPVMRCACRRFLEGDQVFSAA